MLLNRKYYQDLWDKYQNTEPFNIASSDRITELSLKMILENKRKKQSTHFNFQNSNSAKEVAKFLFVELANEIFCNYADFPQLNIGDKVKSKTPMRVGAAEPKFLDFDIIRNLGGKYFIENKKYSITLNCTFTELVEGYIPVSQKTQNKTLTRFASFFEELNGKHVYNFTPTFFDYKSVFVASKSFYDSLEYKSCIPSTYFPSSREENSTSEIKSIAALPDSIIYFVTKYEVCYQKILQLGKQIDAIIVCDIDEDMIPQIIQDQSRFGFSLILLTSKANPSRYIQMPCWSWLKEEAEILELI